MAELKFDEIRAWTPEVEAKITEKWKNS